MDNINLENALSDLVDGIRAATLGSIENVVIDAACKELINNWNDHNKDDQINVANELENLRIDQQEGGVEINVRRGCCGGQCACGESH